MNGQRIMVVRTGHVETVGIFIYKEIMAVQEILQLGHPLLWERSAIVDDPSDTDIRSLIADLRDTLSTFRNSHGYGRGIAAPQISVLKRVLYVNMGNGGFEGALINPEIVESDPRKIELWDACFSFPELLVKVSRAAGIVVASQNEAGEKQLLDAEGDLSELLQHEIDHLDGILAVERAVSPKAFMTRKEWERTGRP